MTIELRVTEEGRTSLVIGTKQVVVVPSSLPNPSVAKVQALIDEALASHAGGGLSEEDTIALIQTHVDVALAEYVPPPSSVSEEAFNELSTTVSDLAAVVNSTPTWSVDPNDPRILIFNDGFTEESLVLRETQVGQTISYDSQDVLFDGTNKNSGYFNPDSNGNLFMVGIAESLTVSFPPDTFPEDKIGHGALYRIISSDGSYYPAFTEEDNMYTMNARDYDETSINATIDQYATYAGLVMVFVSNVFFLDRTLDLQGHTLTVVTNT